MVRSWSSLHFCSIFLHSNCFNSVTRAPYTCRKCRTHGHSVPVKRHKRNCPYKDCGCYKCQLVDKGRFVVAKQIAIYRDQTANSSDKGAGSGSGSASSATPGSTSGAPSAAPTSSDSFAAIKTEIGVASESTGAAQGAASSAARSSGPPDGPHCRRCRNHNLSVVWKGHKKICPFQICRCNPCRLIDERKDTEKALREVADEGPRQAEPLAPTGLFEIPHPKLSSPMKLSPCPSFAMTCESMGWRADGPASSSGAIPHLEHVMKGSTANGLYLGSCRPITCECFHRTWR